MLTGSSFIHMVERDSGSCGCQFARRRSEKREGGFQRTLDCAAFQRRRKTEGVVVVYAP